MKPETPRFLARGPTSPPLMMALTMDVPVAPMALNIAAWINRCEASSKPGWVFGCPGAVFAGSWVRLPKSETSPLASPVMISWKLFASSDQAPTTKRDVQPCGASGSVIRRSVVSRPLGVRPVPSERLAGRGGGEAEGRREGEGGGREWRLRGGSGNKKKKR